MILWWIRILNEFEVAGNRYVALWAAGFEGCLIPELFLVWSVFSNTLRSSRKSRPPTLGSLRPTGLLAGASASRSFLHVTPLTVRASCTRSRSRSRLASELALVSLHILHSRLFLSHSRSSRSYWQWQEFSDSLAPPSDPHRGQGVL